MRKVNDMVKRIRLLNFNVCLLGYLKSQMPYLWGKNYAQEKLIERLPEIFQKVKQLYNLSEGDFPNINEYKDVLRLMDFTTFPSTKREVLLSLRNILNDDIPLIMSHIHHDNNSKDIIKLKEEEKTREIITFPVVTQESNLALYLISINAVILVVVVGIILFYLFATIEQKSQLFTLEQIKMIDGIFNSFKKN